MSTDNTTPFRKGFRQAPKATKGEVAKENQQLSQEIQNSRAQMQFMLNAMMQLSQKIDQELKPELDALTTLEAAYVVDPASADAGAKLGDHVLMDFLGQVLNDDGTPVMQSMNEKGEMIDDVDGTFPKYFDGGYGSTSALQNLGSGKLITGFEEQLIGRKAGETVEVLVTFPEGYAEASLAKKKSKFLVHIHRVYRNVEDSPVRNAKRDYELAKTRARKAVLDTQQEIAAKLAAEEATQPTENTAESAQPQEGASE